MGTVLSFIGSPGSGKGTQAKLLQEAFGFVHITTGDLFRKRMTQDDALGRKIRDRYEKGIPQPDELAAQLVFEEAEMHIAAPGLIFDPFPLSEHQIFQLDSFLSKHIDTLSPAWVVDFVLSEEESVKRLLKRKSQEGRSDDTENVIRKRYQEYHSRIDDITKQFVSRGKYIEIDGSPSIKEVYADLVSKLMSNHLVKIHAD